MAPGIADGNGNGVGTETGAGSLVHLGFSGDGVLHTTPLAMASSDFAIEATFVLMACRLCH